MKFGTVHFYMQRFNFIDFMVIELRFFKKKKNKMKNMTTFLKALFKLLHTSYIITQPIVASWLFFTHSSP